MELLRNALAFPGRLRHRWKHRKRGAASASLQKTLQVCGENAKATGLPSYAGIYNVALYIAIAEHEMSWPKVFAVSHSVDTLCSTSRFQMGLMRFGFFMAGETLMRTSSFCPS